MCTVSMVYDHYQPRIPSNRPPYWPPAPAAPVPDKTAANELRQLIAEFRKAVEAAKTVDRLTDQPDCEDPEKASLEERVRRLEELAGIVTTERTPC